MIPGRRWPVPQVGSVPVILRSITYTLSVLGRTLNRPKRIGDAVLRGEFAHQLFRTSGFILEKGMAYTCIGRRL